MQLAKRIFSILPFLGPAFIASVAYMDPGNFATNIQGGAKFGYSLLWIILSGNLMAMLVQTLSAKLGIATGKNLAEHCRDSFPRALNIWMWIGMELVAIATDIAEFIGAAIGFYLLFGFPLWVSGIITAIATFVILGFGGKSERGLEIIIGIMVAVIALCYFIEIKLSNPDYLGIVKGMFIPSFQGKESVLVASGIIGATIMPHVVYLHSALTQGKHAFLIGGETKHIKRLLNFEMIDIAIAMGLAGIINLAMLIVAASTFYFSGHTGVGTIEEAHKTLTPLLGSFSSKIFAISLLASGISSSVVGTMAGQVIMQGFVKKKIPMFIRRSITIVPSLIIIFMGLEPTRVLIMSQVVLSFGLPLAIIPLIYFTSSKKLMGEFVNKPITFAAMIGIAVLIVSLNFYLIWLTLAGSQ